MASYTTKFSINETAYLIDADALNIVAVRIATVYLNHAAGTADASIAYSVAFPSTAMTARSSRYDEASLMYLEEAKAKVLELINQRTSDIESLK